MTEEYKPINVKGFATAYARCAIKYCKDLPKDGLKTPQSYVAAFDALVGEYEALDQLYGGDTSKMEGSVHYPMIKSIAKAADALLGGETGLVAEDGTYNTANIYEVLRKGKKALNAALGDKTLDKQVDKQDLTNKTACA